MSDEAAPGAIRVGDAERQAVVDRLAHATGDGLLTLDEFAEASGAVYAAVTRGQLDDVVRPLRLPVTTTTPASGSATAAGLASARADADRPSAGADRRRWIVAVMSGEDRKGRWRVGRRTGAFALMGGVELDLRGAVVDDPEIEITAWAVMGNVTVIVPEGIAVESSGFVLMGGRSNRLKDAPPVPGGPVVKVRGFGMWGSVDVRSRPARATNASDGAGTGKRHRDGHARPSEIATATTTPGPDDGLVTIVATDIVGSTRWADSLGDQQWRALLGEHNELVRSLLGPHGGREVKHTGDGFVLAFASPRGAVRFALILQEQLATQRATHPATPIEARIGVHAGEVERDGTDLVGRNVTIACRLCDLAAPGAVLASGLVADLADSASDVGFGDAIAFDVAGLDRQILARPAFHR